MREFVGGDAGAVVADGEDADGYIGLVPVRDSKTPASLIVDLPVECPAGTNY
ncbi:hypothetical protein ACGFY7_44470 [Streptomyces prunicolor]|uniref:hypothetical protein n=1 Tax=Streptomyces prunicolor TaxID=67348 RepID=UPI003711C766